MAVCHIHPISTGYMAGNIVYTDMILFWDGIQPSILWGHPWRSKGGMSKRNGAEKIGKQGILTMSKSHFREAYG